MELNLQRTILVADDTPLIRLLINKRLTLAGHRVEEAADGRVALELALRVRPDLIVLDLVMPVMDGVQAARILRTAPDTRHIPILFLSATGSEQDREAAMMTGRAGFLAKPFRAESLMAAVGSLLPPPMHPVPFDSVPTTLPG